MSETQDILFQLKALGWKDQQIADRLETRRDTIVKIRNNSGNNYTGERFLPALRTLLLEAKQQPQPAREKISRSVQLQPHYQPSIPSAQLPAPSVRLPQVTIVEEYLDDDSDDDEEFSPDVRKAIESSKRLSALQQKPQRAQLPAIRPNIPQRTPARSSTLQRKPAMRPVQQQRPTCEECGLWAPGEPVRYRRDLNLSLARLCSHHVSYAKQQGLLEQ